MNLKKTGVYKFPAIYVTQSWRCVPGNGLRRAAPKLCFCLTTGGNSHLLGPWKHKGGAFISFSFICCHALSVHVIIPITEPTAHVKYVRAYPEKNKMRPWMMNNGKETFLNVVNTRSRFWCRWDWATTGHCAVTENETISGTWALNTAFIHCINDFLRTSPTFPSMIISLNDLQQGPQNTTTHGSEHQHGNWFCVIWLGSLQNNFFQLGSIAVRTFIVKGQNRIKLTLKTKNTLLLFNWKNRQRFRYSRIQVLQWLQQDFPSPSLSSSSFVLALFMAGMCVCYPYCGPPWLQDCILPPMQPQWEKTLSMPKCAEKVWNLTLWGWVGLC